MPLSKRKKLPLRWDELGCVVCVWNLISFNTLPYRIDTVPCDQCYWWAAEHRTQNLSISAGTQIIIVYGLTHTNIHTHTDRTDHTDLQLLWGFAWSTKLAYSDESSHAFGHANRSEQVHMVLRMPSSPIPLCSSSSPSVVLPPNHRLRPSAASRSSIRHRPAYLTDHSS